MIRLRFYTTAGCHLCEQARAMLGYLQANPEVVVETVDIAVSEALVERYGTRIPVVAVVDPASEEGEATEIQAPASQELEWPFEFAQLLELVANRA